jgi:hypothetical protein
MAFPARCKKFPGKIFCQKFPGSGAAAGHFPTPLIPLEKILKIHKRS